jgi:hypothetical protein
MNELHLLGGAAHGIVCVVADACVQAHECTQPVVSLELQNQASCIRRIDNS